MLKFLNILSFQQNLFYVNPTSTWLDYYNFAPTCQKTMSPNFSEKNVWSLKGIVLLQAHFNITF